MTARNALPGPPKRIAPSCKSRAFPCNGSGGNSTFTLFSCGVTTSTKLEWVVDSDFRFFPALPDELFGYVLHPVDLATNKVMAAAGRREPRDVVDLVMIHEQVLPLGSGGLGGWWANRWGSRPKD